MRTKGRLALGLCLATACTPDALVREAAPPPAQASPYVAAPTCGPAAIGSLQAVLPDDGLLGVMEVDVQALQRSPLFRDNKALLEVEAKEVLDGMKACGIPLSAVDRVVAGFGTSDEVVVGVQAKGVGRPKTLDCLGRVVEKSTGKPGWTRTTTGCSTTLEIDGGEAKGFALGQDMLVVASRSVADAVQRRLEGKDKAVLDGRLGWARREVDMSGTAWIAGNMPPGASSALSSSMAGLRRMGLSIDGSRGLGLTLVTGFGSAKEASAAKTELDGMAVQARAMLPLLGLPSSVADTISVSASGTVVSAKVFLSQSDVEALRKTIDGATGGSSTPAERKGI